MGNILIGTGILSTTERKRQAMRRRLRRVVCSTIDRRTEYRLTAALAACTEGITDAEIATLARLIDKGLRL